MYIYICIYIYTHYISQFQSLASSLQITAIKLGIIFWEKPWASLTTPIFSPQESFQVKTAAGHKQSRWFGVCHFLPSQLLAGHRSFAERSERFRRLSQLIFRNRYLNHPRLGLTIVTSATWEAMVLESSKPTVPSPANPWTSDQPSGCRHGPHRPTASCLASNVRHQRVVTAIQIKTSDLQFIVHPSRQAAPIFVPVVL